MSILFDESLAFQYTKPGLVSFLFLEFQCQPLFFEFRSPEERFEKFSMSFSKFTA